MKWFLYLLTFLVVICELGLLVLLGLTLFGGRDYDMVFIGHGLLSAPGFLFSAVALAIMKWRSAVWSRSGRIFRFHYASAVIMLLLFIMG